jgi:TolB protein
MSDTSPYGHDEIYVMDADGSNQTNLTNSPGDDAHPSWSPEGKPHRLS